MRVPGSPSPLSRLRFASRGRSLPRPPQIYDWLPHRREFQDFSKPFSPPTLKTSPTAFRLRFPFVHLQVYLGYPAYPARSTLPPTAQAFFLWTMFFDLAGRMICKLTPTGVSVGVVLLITFSFLRSLILWMQPPLIFYLVRNAGVNRYSPFPRYSFFSFQRGQSFFTHSSSSIPAYQPTLN